MNVKIKRLIIMKLLFNCLFFYCFCILFVEGDYFMNKYNNDRDEKIEMYTFQTFPKDKVALHMPCQESNMFATKCMCHLKCTDSKCSNAYKLCEKYRKS